MYIQSLNIVYVVVAFVAGEQVRHDLFSYIKAAPVERSLILCPIFFGSLCVFGCTGKDIKTLRQRLLDLTSSCTSA